MGPAVAQTMIAFHGARASLGRRGLGRTWPNPAVGAVIVKDGVIVGRGWTQPGGRPHAEVEALRRAGEAARGATLYVTLEPCSHHGKSPPCADAVIAAGISRVVSALEDPNPEVAGAGHARLRAAGIAVDVGVGAEEARHDHAGHIRRMRDGRPHVMLKLAISADGKAARAGRQAGRDYRRGGARARPSAARAKRRDHDRHRHGAGRRSDADLPLPGMGKIRRCASCSTAGCGCRSTSRLVAERARDAGLGHRRHAGAAGRREQRCWRRASRCSGRRQAPTALDLKDALKAPGRAGITRLMVEGGPTLAAALIAADLVDEAVLFHSAKAVGDDGIDALDAAAHDGADGGGSNGVGSEPSGPTGTTYMSAGKSCLLVLSMI